jgi:hypothetical protein
LYVLNKDSTTFTSDTAANVELGANDGMLEITA